MTSTNAHPIFVSTDAHFFPIDKVVTVEDFRAIAPNSEFREGLPYGPRDAAGIPTNNPESGIWQLRKYAHFDGAGMWFRVARCW